MANCANVEQCRLWRRIDQQVEVAAVRIQSLRNGPEDARIAGTMRLHDAAYAGTMGMQSVRWFHRYGSQSDEGDRIVTLWGADAPPATVSPIARQKVPITLRLGDGHGAATTGNIQLLSARNDAAALAPTRPAAPGH